MATIFKNAAILRETPIGNFPTFDLASMEADVLRYWQDADSEKFFPLALWKAKQLLAASATGELALRVTNLHDRTTVDARWVVFDEALEATVQDPVEQGVRYYVLNETFFLGPIIISTEPIVAISGIGSEIDTPANTILAARIGESTLGHHFVFIITYNCTIIDRSGQGGGGGTSSGTKLPPYQ